MACSRLRCNSSGLPGGRIIHLRATAAQRFPDVALTLCFQNPLFRKLLQHRTLLMQESMATVARSAYFARNQERFRSPLCQLRPRRLTEGLAKSGNN
jgi:hypothetical protein